MAGPRLQAILEFGPPWWAVGAAAGGLMGLLTFAVAVSGAEQRSPLNFWHKPSATVRLCPFSLELVPALPLNPEPKAKEAVQRSPLSFWHKAGTAVRWSPLSLGLNLDSNFPGWTSLVALQRRGLRLSASGVQHGSQIAMG